MVETDSVRRSVVGLGWTLGAGGAFPESFRGLRMGPHAVAQDPFSLVSPSFRIRLRFTAAMRSCHQALFFVTPR